MKTKHFDPFKNWTLEAFIQLEESKTSCELIDGKLILAPPATPFHLDVSGRLYVLLVNAASTTGGKSFLGPLDLYVDKRNVFQPSLMYLSPEKLGYITPRAIEGPPDVVVEILSPSNDLDTVHRKKTGYLQFGVCECWIVDPIRKDITVFTPSSGEDTPLHIFAGDQATSTVFPALTFCLDAIFPA